MNRQYRKLLSLVLSALVAATGCHPTQPFFFHEDGDLSHYLDVATDIEYPDVDEPRLDEVNCAQPPLTLKNIDDYEMWDLSLQEVMRITLCNSQVMRQLGVRVLLNPLGTTAPETISRTIVNTVTPGTAYDPAIVESGYGLPTGTALASGPGVEAALAAFDAQLDASVTWNKNREPQNRPDAGPATSFFPSIFAQDLGIFTTGITKTTADGTTFSFRNNTNYQGNNTPAITQPLPSWWTTNFEASFSRPLLQGAGTQYNRIAGPMSFQQYATSGASNVIDGVVIARINTDTALADFEGGVRDLTHDVEEAYWDLYFAYRNLAAQKMGRDSALATWTKTAALFRTGSRGGSADREAQARAQYFVFRGQVEQAMSDLFTAESHLRYVMGLSVSDGRLIRPSDEPTTARMSFDWATIHSEAITRRVEVRKEKWLIKERELQLIAARNYLLPRLDATGTYRWLGLGDDLINPARGQGRFNQPGSTAFGVLTGGEFQEWQIGLELSMPLGFRQELSAVRNHELLLARERALLQDLELEVSHQLGDAVRNVDLYYSLTQTNFNRRVAAEKEVQAVQAAYDANRATMDLLLQAQARRAEAESAYYRSLVNYNRAIMGVHYRKGSLLDYNGVYLAEGPWPGKAYFDALRQARKRDASMYLDYGFTRPDVMSRGPYQRPPCQQACPSGAVDEIEMMPGEGVVPESAEPEEVMPAPSSAAPMLAPPDAFSSTPAVPMIDLAAGNARRSSDEHQTNYPVAQTAANAPVGRRAER
jgi:outer membrane protein TolC